MDAGGADCTSGLSGSLAFAALESDGFFGAEAICGRCVALGCLATFLDALLTSFFNGRSVEIVGAGSGNSSPTGGGKPGNFSRLNHWDRASRNSLIGPQAARPLVVASNMTSAVLGPRARIS